MTTIELNKELLNELLAKEDYLHCAQVLKEEFKIIKNEDNEIIP